MVGSGISLKWWLIYAGVERDLNIRSRGMGGGGARRKIYVKCEGNVSPVLLI